MQQQKFTAPVGYSMNFILIGALMLGLLLAMFLGTLIGQSESKVLLGISLGVLALLFAISLYRYVWQTALFLLFFGFGYRPTGFAFGGVELGCGLGVAVIAIFIWQKKKFVRPAILAQPAFRMVERVLFVWLAYVALHMFFNIRFPYSPGEFKLSNAIKSYFVLSAPLFLLFYFVRNPSGLVVGPKFFWRFAQILFAGLMINLALRIYELAGGGILYIPIINATASMHILRGLSPFAMMIGVIGLTGPASERRSGFRTLVYASLAFIGAFAAVMSGGRVAIVYGFLCVCFVLLLRRRIPALAVVAALSILGLVAANLASGWINSKANPYLQRSMQWALLNKDWQTVRDLEASTNWRWELAQRALDEWRSDPRIFWTGRATFGFGSADETSLLIQGGYEALIQTALRRGATHNLITDLLIAYGLIGLILYFALFIALLRFLWRLHKSKQLSPPAVNMATACFVYALYSFFLAVTSGSYFPPEVIWCLLVLVAGFYNGVALTDPRTRQPGPVEVKPKSVSEGVRLPVGQRRLVRGAKSGTRRGPMSH